MNVHFLKSAGKSAVKVHHHGAHVTSWTNSAGCEMIYTSPSAIYDGKKAIRGGIPICFPQFGKHGPLHQHGFARNTLWTRDTTFAKPADGDGVRFILKDSESTRTSKWPHRFLAAYTISLSATGDSLCVSLEITNNNDEESFTFTTALHSYFICDATATTLAGFDGLSYADNIGSDGPGNVKLQSGSISFGKEVDRVYRSTPDDLSISNVGLTLHKVNLPDAVVWNPYMEKAAALSDMPDDDWEKFICIEPARVYEPAVLGPGETWVCKLTMKSNDTV